MAQYEACDVHRIHSSVQLITVMSQKSQNARKFSKDMNFSDMENDNEDQIFLIFQI